MQTCVQKTSRRVCGARHSLQGNIENMEVVKDFEPNTTQGGHQDEAKWKKDEKEEEEERTN